MIDKELAADLRDEQLPAIVTDAYRALINVWVKSNDRRLTLEQFIEYAALFMGYMAANAEDDLEGWSPEPRRITRTRPRMVRRVPSK